MAKQDPKELDAIQQETINKTEQFFESNKKGIYGAVCAIAVIALLILCYQKFYLQPKKAEALSQLYPAEAAFRSEAYDVALKGDGNTLGFEQIIDEYGSKAGKVVYFYAGVSALYTGEYNDAISYLKKYSGKDSIMSARATACIGDAYAGLENYKTALSYYEKAASTIDNIYAATYLLKAGIVCEELGDNAKALEFYNKIKDQYPGTLEGSDIDKYIARIENK